MKKLYTLSLLIFIFFSSYAQIASLPDKVRLNNENDSIKDEKFDAEHKGIVFEKEEFNKGVAFSPLELIQGRVAGMVINSMDGNDPNPSLQVQIRGTSTLINGSELLYVVDGIPVQSPDFLVPENIQSIEVLKSVATTAKYGVRGANGVVIVNTFHETPKKFSLSYSTYGYVESSADNSMFMSADEWRELKSDWSNDPLMERDASYLIDYGANTDWMEEISQHKISQAHNIGFSGSLRNTQYSGSINYHEYHGIMQKTGNKELTGQLSIKQSALNDKFHASLNLAESTENSIQINDNPYLCSEIFGEIPVNFISHVNGYNPTVPVYDENGSFARDTSDYLYHSFNSNPVKALMNTDDNRSIDDILVALNIDYEVVKGLKLIVGYSYNNRKTENVFSKLSTSTIYEGEQHLSSQRNNYQYIEKTYSTKMNYTGHYGDHNIDISLGYSKVVDNFCNLYRDSVITYRESVITEGLTTSKSFSLYMDEGHINQSFFSVDYDYRGRYRLSGGAINEKSAGFLSNTTSSYLMPFASFEWSVGEERFLSGIKWLDAFDVHVDYGITKHSIKSSDYYEGYSNFLVVDLSGIPYIPVIPDLETKKELNTGFDIVLLSGKIGLTADYYREKSSDAVFEFSSFSSYEVGSPAGLINCVNLWNNGLELGVNASVLDKALKWDMSFNYSTNNNAHSNACLDAYLAQQPIGNFYGYKFAGFSDDNEFLAYDTDGNITKYASEDFYIGNGHPKSFYGLFNKFRYKNLELSFLVRAAEGFEIKNFNGVNFVAYAQNFPDDLADMEYPEVINYLRSIRSDLIIENGDYIKLDHVYIGYNIPFKNKSPQSAIVYVTCNNLAIITGFSGSDPEAAGISGDSPGVYGYERYPFTRLYSLGFKVNF